MQSYAQIGTALGFAPSPVVEEKDHMIRLVKDYLEGWSQRWLLVFDNYDEPQKFPKIHQFIPRFGQGHVIITSRNGQLDRLGHLMEVPAMNITEGVKLFLRGHSAQKIEQYSTIASSIVERLGGLALAIDQAAAYIRYRRLPLQRLDNFLEIYETKRKDVLSHTPPNFWEYTTSQTHGAEQQAKAINAFTTWEMSLEQLNSDSSLDSEGLIHLLTLSAFFNPTRIEEFLFRNHWEQNSQRVSWLRCISRDEEETNEGSNNEASDHDEDLNEVSDEKVSDQDSSSQELDILWDSDRYSDLVSTFHELSLLQSLEKVGEDAVFSLHPLIRDWLQLRESTAKRQSYIEESIEVIAASVKTNDGKTMSFKYNSALLAHIDACLANDEHFSKKQHQLGKCIENCHTAFWLAEFYHEQGRYQVAEKLFREIVATEQKMLGMEHKDTLRDMNYLASTLREQGKHDEAEELTRQTLQLRQKVFGKEHVDTIESLNQLAYLFYRKGKYDNAEKLYRQVLHWRITKLGQEKPETLSTMTRLGWVVNHQGKYEEAVKMQRQTLHLLEQALGSEHNDYILGMSSLASTLCNQGKYEEAEQLQRLVLHFRETSLGKKHPDTLTAMNNLASTLKVLGKYEEAEQMFRETLQMSQEVLGSKHPETLSTMNNLAELLGSQGSDKAQEMHRETLELRKQLLGIEHPETLNSMHNLAFLLLDHEAEPLYRETLRLRQEVLGSNHPDTLATMHNLAFILPNHEAEPLYRETLRLSQEVLGNNHPDTLRTMHNLASKLPNHEAETLFREVLRLSVQVLGKKNPDKFYTMEWLVLVLWGQGKNDEAAGIMKDLAVVLREQGKDDEAETIEQQLLTITESDDSNDDNNDASLSDAEESS